MSKKKWVLACIAVSCSGLINANASEINKSSSCEQITPQNYTEFMKTEVARAVKNPFSNSNDKKAYSEDYCMTMSFKSHDTPILSKNDFANSEKIYSTYNQFMRGEEGLDQANVTMDFDPESEQLFTFFKFPHDGDVMNEYKKHWRKNRLLMAHYEDFIFLHELMHTDAELTMSERPRNEKEAIDDIAAVIVLQSQKNLSPDITYKIMKQLDRARKTKVPVMGSRKKEVDHDHLHRGYFSKALDFFEKIADNDVNLRVTSFKEARDIALDIVDKSYEFAYESVVRKEGQKLAQNRAVENEYEMSP